jgi:hypothetical protein
LENGQANLENLHAAYGIPQAHCFWDCPFSIQIWKRMLRAIALINKNEWFILMGIWKRMLRVIALINKNGLFSWGLTV